MRAFLLVLGLTLGLSPAGRADEASDIADLADPDAAALRRLKVPVTPAGVLTVIKEATGADVPDADLAAAIADLGGGKDAREQAIKKLAAWGPVAAPPLRVAAGSADAEVARLARELLDQLSKTHARPALPSAIRVLLRQKDAAIIEPLVRVLPFVQDPELEADLWYGLDKHAARDPATVKTIIDRTADPMAARRALAGHFAARHGGEAGKTKSVALLADPVPLVRLRAAQGLLAVRDARGIPALIGLLTTDDNEIRWQAEELLRWSAPAGCPTEPIGTTDLKRRTAAQAAWREWWTKSGERVDFAAADQTARRPILMLICDRTTGRIALIGSDGKPRAEWPALERLNDARYLPGGDVAAAQGTGPVNTGESRLCVRRPGGEVVWEYKDLENPAGCQLLPDGRLFVPEHPRAGEKSFRFQIFAPTGRCVEHQPDWADGKYFNVVHWMPGERLLCQNAISRRRADEAAISSLLIYEAEEGRRVKLPALGWVRFRTLRMEMLPTAGYLIAGLDEPDPTQNDLLVLDGFGREKWKHHLRGTRHAIPLRSGNFLVCAGDRLVELTRDHRTVGETVLRQDADTDRPCAPLVRLGFDSFPSDRDLILDVEHYARELSDRDELVRLNALTRISEMRNRPVQILTDIKRCVSDPDAKVRTAAAKALAIIDESKIPKLLLQSKDPDFKVRIDSINQLQVYGRANGVLDALCSGLKDPHWEVRKAAAGALGNYHPDSNYESPRRQTLFGWAVGRVLPALIDAASAPRQNNDKDMQVQETAIFAIGRIGRADVKRAVAFLIQGIHDTPKLEYRCVQMLSEFGDVSPEVLPALIREFNRPGGRKTPAIYGIRSHGPKAAKMTDTLLSAYQERVQFPVEQANGLGTMYLETLAAIGPTDERVPVLLLNVLGDVESQTTLRLVAAGELSRLERTVARAALTKLEQWDMSTLPREDRYQAYRIARDIRFRLAEPND